MGYIKSSLRKKKKKFNLLTDGYSLIIECMPNMFKLWVQFPLILGTEEGEEQTYSFYS